MPTIKVERCSDKTFRLTTKEGEREFISNFGNKWDRSFAMQAKDIFERLYGMKRKNIKFHHVN